ISVLSLRAIRIVRNENVGTSELLQDCDRGFDRLMRITAQKPIVLSFPNKRRINVTFRQPTIELVASKDQSLLGVLTDVFFYNTRRPVTRTVIYDDDLICQRVNARQRRTEALDSPDNEMLLVVTRDADRQINGGVFSGIAHDPPVMQTSGRWRHRNYIVE